MLLFLPTPILNSHRTPPSCLDQNRVGRLSGDESQVVGQKVLKRFKAWGLEVWGSPFTPKKPYGHKPVQQYPK